MISNDSKPDPGAGATTHYLPSSSVIGTKEAERRLRWKIDLYIVPIVALLYALCTIDRVNIGNARLAGLERTLDLHGNDFNALLSIFYVSYILFSMPATWVIKWIGPGWVLPGTTLIFGILTVSFAFVKTFAQAAAVRFLLGIFEADLFGGSSYYMSRWYRKSELAIRLSLYVVMAPLSGAASGLLASAILKLDHFGSTSGWEMIFAIEGVATIGLALVALLVMTDRPETALWLTQEEKALAIFRVQDERVAITEALDIFDRKKVVRGLWNPVVLFTSISLDSVQITIQASLLPPGHLITR
ncbi:hypothetical protein N0V86_000881 [Didymella sp. IMI 355093]|nr:hypothetical protein N0V86_000881 [Didymella sp. IMI 355093]